MCQRRAGLALQPQPAAPAGTPSPSEQDATFWKVSSVLDKQHLLCTAEALV